MSKAVKMSQAVTFSLATPGELEKEVGDFYTWIPVSSSWSQAHKQERKVMPHYVPRARWTVRGGPDSPSLCSSERPLPIHTLPFWGLWGPWALIWGWVVGTLLREYFWRETSGSNPFHELSERGRRSDDPYPSESEGTT